METPPQSATFRWDGRKFVPAGTVALADRGFRYGMMVFETMALHAGRPDFLEEHLARLRAACAATGLLFPEMAGAALPAGPERGMARIYVTAGPGAIDAPAASEVFYACEERSPALPAAYRLHDQPGQTLAVWPGFKTGNYWAHARALTTARKAGFNEAVMTNADGLIVSAAMANIFAVISGELVTPPLAAGARDGVIRAWVAAHHPVTERAFSMAELESASEIFLTSSGFGVMPVSHLGSCALMSQATAETLRALPMTRDCR